MCRPLNQVFGETGKVRCFFIVKQFAVTQHDLRGQPPFDGSPLVQEQGTIGQGTHTFLVVRHKQQCCSVGYQFFDALEAAFLKQCVAHGKRFVHDKDFRLHLHLNSKSKPNQHAAGVGFNRLVQVLADIGEGSDGIELFVYLIGGKT